MLNIISEIDEFKGAWQLLGRLSSERLGALKKVATIESVGSSTRIEGAKLSDQEVEALLSRASKNSFRTRDEQEVVGYARVCEEIFAHFRSIPFTENMIKQFHGDLQRYSEKDVRHKGEYKKIESHIEAFDEKGKSLGIVFETTSAFETPYKMQELVLWTRVSLESKETHPLITIGVFIVLFLAIHPFQDGNGRLSRCLTTLLLLQTGYTYVPYSSLESIIEESKDSYYLALSKTQKSLKNHVDFSPWMIFFLRSLLQQKRRLEEKISRENLLLQLTPLSAQILELLKEHGRLSLSEFEKLMKANRNTLKKHLQELVKTAQIQKHGKGRATWYTL